MKNKKLIIILCVIIAIIIIIGGAIIWYTSGTKAVNKSSEEETIIEIAEGTRTEGILDLLIQNKLIKNKLVAGLYIKLNGVKGLQAGKYELSQNMSLAQILEKLSSGDVYNDTVKITFKEGKNMRWYAKQISEKTNNTEEDVFSLLKDEQYIASQVKKYWFLTDNITNQDIYYQLEGYLYPDTYIFENKDVSVKNIFSTILNNTDKILSKYKTQIQTSGKSIHEIMTMASMVELEGNDSEARKGIASVFYNRLSKNMSLGSDVTTYYAFKVDMGERNLYSEEIKTYNPYNTRGPRMSGKLPVGPICNPSKDAIEAALNPAQTSYLYFVADQTGKIYFTSTYEEHKKQIQNLQAQGIWHEYN